MRPWFPRVGGAALAIALFVLAGGQARPAAAAPASAVPYYLALGDSLSQGVQPFSTAPGQVTNQGYVDDLYAYYRTKIPGLKLEKLGCPGASTTSMINGGGCSYTLGSQLAQAVNFLQQHHVAMVTFDIGPNDVNGCLYNGDPSNLAGIQACVFNVLTTEVGPNLTDILDTLQQAAGPDVPIFAMNFYDPFLAYWVLGNQALAMASEQLTLYVNDFEESIYAAHQVLVADVEQAFQTDNWTVIQPSGLPLNVATVCTLTWMCTSYHDIHANAAGYAVIAVTFEDVIGNTVSRAAA